MEGESVSVGVGAAVGVGVLPKGRLHEVSRENRKIPASKIRASRVFIGVSFSVINPIKQHYGILFTPGFLGKNWPIGMVKQIITTHEAWRHL
jgi:hypothetical protein